MKDDGFGGAVKLTSGKLVAVIAVAAGVMAVALTVTRNMMLDRATLQMKTGEFDRAATKLKLLANVGDSTPQSSLGDLYAYGWGISKDDETAIYWYRRSGPLARLIRLPDLSLTRPPLRCTTSGGNTWEAKVSRAMRQRRASGSRGLRRADMRRRLKS